MSTDPTTVLDPTAVTDPALDIESIKEIMDAFDPAELLPELAEIFRVLTSICQIAVMIAPILLLVLGLAYLFLSPKEANYYFGYRCYFGMGSVQAWRFTQRIAGLVLGVLGLVLSGVMLFLAMGFPGLPPSDMVWRALRCLIWQAALVLIANLGIWLTVTLRFDAKGHLRNRRK